MGMIDDDLVFEDDALYRYTPAPQLGSAICIRELVITKRAFIECYKKWIKECEDGNVD